MVQKDKVARIFARRVGRNIQIARTNIRGMRNVRAHTQGEFTLRALGEVVALSPESTSAVIVFPDRRLETFSLKAA